MIEPTRINLTRTEFPCILTCVLIFRIVVLLAFPLTEDGQMYHQTGSEIAGRLKTGSPIDNLESYQERLGGTRTYAVITGAFYYAFARSYLLIMAFNSLLGGLGSLLFYRAVMSRYPHASLLPRCMIFLDPSIVLWTSIHGKDPIVFFLLAVAFWSLSRVLSGTHGCFLLYAVSVAAIATIRLHVALIVAIATFLCLLRMRKAVGNRAAKGFLSLSLALFGAMAVAIVTTNIRELSSEVIISQVADTLTGLSTGGSAMYIPEISTASDLLAYLPRGMVGVLFRPLPWDSGGMSVHAAAAAQAVVSCAVIVIALRLWKRGLQPDPLRSFMVAYSVLFVALFALIVGNLGTLVREKAQLVPFIWCLWAATDSMRNKPLLSAEPQ